MSWLSKTWKKATKHVVTWHKGALNTAKFWDPKSVVKGIRQQLDTSADPLGKAIVRGARKMSGGSLSNATSASAYASSSPAFYSGVYGVNGSILGRY